MLNQIVPKIHPILSNRLGLLRKRFLHARGVISLTHYHKIDTNRSLINGLLSQHLQSTTSLPKHYCSTATSSSSNVSSKTHREGKTDDREVLINDDTLDKLFKDVDQRISEVNLFLETDGRSRQLKTFGLIVTTMVAGVIVGAYTAHFGAWFLEKVGLFIFEEEDDD